MRRGRCGQRNGTVLVRSNPGKVNEQESRESETRGGVYP